MCLRLTNRLVRKITLELYLGDNSLDVLGTWLLNCVRVKASYRHCQQQHFKLTNLIIFFIKIEHNPTKQYFDLTKYIDIFYTNSLNESKLCFHFNLINKDFVKKCVVRNIPLIFLSQNYIIPLILVIREFFKIILVI